MIDVLALLLPTDRETRLLRACLLDEGGPLEVLRSAGPLDSSWPPLPMTPLLAAALARRDHDDDSGFGPYRGLALGLRAVRLKSEIRSRTVRRLLGEALDALAAAGVEPFVLRGAALAETAYPDPALRHCHDLDLLTATAEAWTAARALGEIGFTPDPSARPPAGAGPRLLHANGLPLHLHHRAFRLAFHEPPAESFPGRGEVVAIAGTRARVLAPAEQLFHVLGHAASGSGRDTLRWACDAWFLLRRRADLDWVRFEELADRSRLAFPLSVQLPYLRDELAAPVPQEIIERIARLASHPDARAREAALRVVRSGRRGTAIAVLRASRGVGARLEAARWIALPTPTCMRWTRPGIGAAGITLHYLTCPIRGVARMAARAYLTRRRPPAVLDPAPERDEMSRSIATTA